MKALPTPTRLGHVLATVLIAWLAIVTRAEQPAPHPGKKVYMDAQTWPVIAPADTDLRRFQPFRAVYRRHYKQHGGPNAGDPRTDRLIVHAEEVAWDGRRAIAVQLIDSGIVAQADTNARGLTAFVAMDDLSLLFEIGPIPGKAKDYYLLRREPDTLVGTMVTTASGEAQVQRQPVDQPGFGPGMWALASHGLAVGQRLRLAPVISPQGNPLTGFTTFGRVIGKEPFTAGDGSRFDAWVVESAGRPSSPRVPRFYLVDRPPYYLGTVNADLDSGEASDFIRLERFQAFDS